MALQEVKKKAYIFEIGADQKVTSDIVQVSILAGDGATQVDLNLPIREATKVEAGAAEGIKAINQLELATEANAEIKETNSNLTRQNSELARANDELKREIDDLKNEVPGTADQIVKLKEEIETLNAMVEEQSVELARLKNKKKK